MRFSLRKLPLLILLLALLAGLASGCSAKLPEEPALRVGEDSISASEFMFYYCSGVNSYISQNYLVMTTGGYDFTLSPSAQTSEYQGKSWNDLFIENTVGSLSRLVALTAEAKAAGFSLTEEELDAAVEQKYSEIKASAKSNNLSVKEFIRSFYGKNITEELFREYTSKAVYAQAYANYCYNDEAVTEEEAAAVRTSKPEVFTEITFRLRPFFPSGNDGSQTLEDARNQAYAFLEGLTDDASFEAAAQALLAEDSADKGKDVTLYKEFLLSNVTSTEIQKWFTDPARHYGDTAVFGSADRFMAVMFMSVSPADYNVADIALLHTETEARAEEYKALFDGSEKTEEAFGKLKENSATFRTNLTKDVLTQEDDDWIFDASRKPGDTAVIKEDDGYSLIWYINKGAAYREYKAENMARSDKYTALMNSLNEKYPVSGQDDAVIDKIISIIESK